VAVSANIDNPINHVCQQCVLVKLKLWWIFEFSVSNTRRHAYKLYEPRHSKVRDISFPVELHVLMCGLWNSLLDSVSFKSLQSFKHTINTVDFSKFLVFLIQVLRATVVFFYEPCCPARSFYQLYYGSF